MWKCFHCGYEANTKKEAEAHFGDEGGLPSLCIDWVTMNDHERASEYQSLTIELEEERKENDRLRSKLEKSK